MAFTDTGFETAIAARVLYESSMTNAVQSNITGGPGTLYSVNINSSNDQVSYVKIANLYTASSGSTAPDWIFACAANSSEHYEIPGGISFDYLSIWLTVNPSPADNTGPTLTGNEAVAVTVVTG
tara:strand:+ start:261 stop:632 length:372 start_codon:yes stop_codon:yes gene_type:complete